MKGIISRLRVLSPRDCSLTFGVTWYWIPSLDCWLVVIVSWYVCVVFNTVSAILPSPFGNHFPFNFFTIAKLATCWRFNFTPGGRSLGSTIPNCFSVVSVQVLSTASDVQFVSHAPQFTSLNPVCSSIPNIATVLSYIAVSTVTFASTLFVSIQMSESGEISMSPE